ncbi:uroporphyrinogen decarboxylase family protein [Desulfosporosinus sp. PR]|uniref:uroporphyrinogen decarboxylase family protein n=1 Tax=Candidatus Desulfosporosinus nitrosoreducens TaxID=3401928 RepID=UPI0027ECEEF7|nr:uroporphyrinogen decarboxylase family protein [Desulfosporosinus sp. PR]MDQ7094846.1 uroporphyrinogen decarboxylase family protein [Desulfosporosinus sp. PR]
MTKIERVMVAINFAKADRIPKGEFYLEDGFIAGLLDLKEGVTFRDQVEACERCGLDALAFSPSPFTASLPPDSGSRPEKAEVWQELKRWREQTDFFIFAIIDGPFQGTAKLFSSFTNYLLAIAQGDPAIPELVKEGVATNIELGLKALALGAHGIIIADDIAYNGGTFISPKTLRLNFFPGLREQVEVLQRAQAPVFFHADGDLKAVLNDIVSLGINGLHSLDFSSLAEIADVRKATAHKVCLMGGYDLSWFEEETRKDKALRLLEVAAQGGGYIFGSSAGIISDRQSPQKVMDVYRFVGSYDE